MLLAVATFTVVWLVVSPASAALLSSVGTPVPARIHGMAPVCDPRGAIGFAPPPQIQDAELSLDIPADCFDVNPLESKNYAPGHRSTPLDISSSQEPAARTTELLPARVLSERLAARVEVVEAGPPGFHTSIERPPRA